MGRFLPLDAYLQLITLAAGRSSSIGRVMHSIRCTHLKKLETV